MPSDRSRTTAKAPPLSEGPVRRSLLVFEKAETRAVELPAEGVVVVGRSEDADLDLRDSSVSRQQLELTVSASGVVARDLGSSNGTFLDEELLRESRPLRPGAVLRAGATLLVLGDTRPAGDPACLTHLQIEGTIAGRVASARQAGEGLAIFLVRAAGAREVVSSAIRATLGGDAVVGEYATDHYQAVIRAASESRGAALARSLRRALGDKGLDAEVACAVLSQDGSSPEELLAACHAALATRSSRPIGSGPVIVDPTMKRTFEHAARVANGRLAVLIQGETGCGKEIVAEHIQKSSPRAGRPFVRVNCAALPEPLLEAELFGHEKGAFTGAVRPKPGLFEAADGGTLLLDEVGDLPIGQQAKLLRVLENGTVRRLGSLKDLRVDVRIVASTNRDLEEASTRGAFRADLFFRLGGAIVTVPPLRERPRDVIALALHFLSESAPGLSLDPAAEQALLRHSWPGNVRELKNAMERAALLAGAGPVTPEHLPRRILATRPGPCAPADAPSAAPSWDAVQEELRAIEKARIVEALDACDGNQTRAAAKLGIPRRTFVTKLSTLGLSRRRPGGA